MKRNFNLIFFLKKRNDTQIDGLSIYLRITVSKKRAETATGKKCLENEWSNGQLKGNSLKSKTLNAYLKQLELQVHDAHRILLTLGIKVTADSLMNEYLGKTERRRMLKEVFEDHNHEMAMLVGKDFSKMTLLRYQTALRHIEQFMRKKYNISDIDIKKPTINF